MSNFENKKIYLLTRINEERDNIEKHLERGYNSEFEYVLKQSRDRFFFSAPEIVDYCYYVLSNYISLDRDSYENSPIIKNRNLKGEPIKCLKCDCIGHVYNSCKN